MTSLAINPTQVTASTCCYCGVGCGVLIEHDGQNILGVSGDPAHPANFGKLCSKGSSLHLTGDVDARALYPELRLSKGLARSVTDWDTALEHAANVFADSIREHGPDSVAFYISGQLLTEDYYAFNKLARALVGTNNIDSNSRLCMSSAVAGYKRSLGADAPPCSYEDIELSDCVLIVGSNMAYAHPVLFRRLEEAKSHRPHMKIIVIDPRRTDTCELADLHLAIQPGTDVALFHGLLHLLIRDKQVDPDFIAAHTQGYAELSALADNYPPDYVATLCGISAQQLHTCARWIGESPSVLSLWCMGLNQSSAGSAKNSALINLHLATGQIGRPGAGPFSLTGQPNAMGGRETGSLSNLLPGHRDAGNAEHRAQVADYWGVDSLPANPGLSAIELFEQLQRGTIKALWIACTNPAQSLPDQNRVRQALESCPFVVLQEAFKTTETARFADLLLPAASWGEKEGTVTNSERRISNVRKAIAPPVKRAQTGQSLWISLSGCKNACSQKRLRCSISRPLTPCSMNSKALPPDAIWTCPASTARSSTDKVRSNGRFQRVRQRARHACTRTLYSRRLPGVRSSCAKPMSRPENYGTPSTRSRSTLDVCVINGTA